MPPSARKTQKYQTITRKCSHGVTKWIQKAPKIQPKPTDHLPNYPKRHFLQTLIDNVGPLFYQTVSKCEKTHTSTQEQPHAALNHPQMNLKVTFKSPQVTFKSPRGAFKSPRVTSKSPRVTLKHTETQILQNT